MRPPEDAGTPTDSRETEEQVVARMRSERDRLAAERRALREQRREQERKFACVVLVSALVFFAIGVAIAMVVWRPTSPGQSPASGAEDVTPVQPAAPNGNPDAPPTPANDQPVDQPTRQSPARPATDARGPGATSVGSRGVRIAAGIAPAADLVTAV